MTEPPSPDDPLAAFSQGHITKAAAVRALGLRDYAQLLLTLGERGLPLPKLPPDEVTAMVETFIGLYRQEDG